MAHNTTESNGFTITDGYKEALNNKIAESVSIKKKIDGARTTLKRKYYSKKLIKSNKIVARIALKLDRLLKLSERTSS